MKGTILIVAIFLFAAGMGRAQEPADTVFGTGLLVDQAAFSREVEMTPDFSNDGRRADDLPRWFSLRPYTPYPKNQGGINSCIGWAMGYAAMTTQRAFERRITNRKEITDNAFSALFIYNQVKEGSCMSGAFLHKAAQLLTQTGDCRSADFDFPYTECDREPKAELFNQSKNHLIRDFAALFDKDTPARTAVMRCKRSIAEGKPVVVGMNITESLKRLHKLDSKWQPSGSSSDKPLGGHALCVVGYNDSLGVFEIMNSWGPSWGDMGYFQVSYKTFTEYAFQGIQLILPPLELSPSELADIEKRKNAAYEQQQQALARRESASRAQSKADLALQEATDQGNLNKMEQAREVIRRSQLTRQEAESSLRQADRAIQDAELTTAALAGDFAVRVLLTDDFGTPLRENGRYLFEEATPHWTGAFYELDKKDWMEGDMFQVVARNIKKDSYVYLFSLDGNNKAEVHWPRNQRFEQDLNGHEAAGAGEGAMVAHSGAEIVIPGNDRVLTRENLLADHLCVLYSNVRIEDFRQRLIRMRDECRGDFEARLRIAFGDLLIPVQASGYETDMMRCRVEKPDGGTAVAIVVKVENE